MKQVTLETIDKFRSQDGQERACAIGQRLEEAGIGFHKTGKPADEAKRT